MVYPVAQEHAIIYQSEAVAVFGVIYPQAGVFAYGVVDVVIVGIEKESVFAGVQRAPHVAYDVLARREATQVGGQS